MFVDQHDEARMEGSFPPRHQYWLSGPLRERAAAWLDECSKNPVQFLPTLEFVGDSDCCASLLVLPHIDRAERPERREPFTLFGGALRGLNGTRLRTALRNTGIIYGVKDKEALAVMTHGLAFILCITQLQRGIEPILPGPFFPFALTPAEGDEFVKRANKPRLQIEPVLDLWFSKLAGLDLRQLWTGPPGNGVGRLVYYTFPPVWMTIEQLDEVFRGEDASGQIPLHVDLTLFATVARFHDFLKQVQATGAPLQLQIGSPGQIQLENAILSKTPPDVWEEKKARNAQPTEKVQELAYSAKKLKNAKHTRSMQDIAVELGTTPDAIRYAYRAMHWQWERADRVRRTR